MLTPDNVNTYVGYWFRVLLPEDRRIFGRITAVAADGKTILVEACPLTQIDVEDTAVWAENDCDLGRKHKVARELVVGN